MSPARVAAPDKGAGSKQSSHTVEDANPAIFKPAWFILDDINIDLISLFTTMVSLLSIFVFRYPVKAVLPVAAVLVLPLRLFFPRPKSPQGLVLITGASSGIGAELTYLFASRGHDLILVGRSEEQIDKVAKNVENKYDTKPYTIVSDLSVPGAAKELYDHVKSKGFTVDVLVNDAAIGAAGDSLEMPIEIVERMVTLNCITLVQLTQLFGTDMVRRRHGWILQVSSVVGWMSSPGQNLYHATKHFVRSFTEALSIEMRAHPDIVLTQLMPGPVHTQFMPRAHAEETFIFAASGTVEDPRDVAVAGYEGLCKRKRMVFSSWNAAVTATSMHLMPRSLHLTVARLVMAPMRGLARAEEPMVDQGERKL